MKIFFELSKEHTTLPQAEVIACLNAQNIDYDDIESNEDIIILTASACEDEIKRLADRLALTYSINRLLFSCAPTINDIKINALKTQFKIPGSFAIHCLNRSQTINSRVIVRILGTVFGKNRCVNLENPDVILHVLITNRTIYVGVELTVVDRRQYEKRKVQYRPFFSPTSLHPRLARALVNLSLVKKDETVLDPFCGTGGILLEAGLIGAHVIGVDVEDKMIQGCKKTLDFYKIKDYQMFCCDVSDTIHFVPDVDAIVTDLPYGKAATTKGEMIEQLYRRAFQSMSKLLIDGSRAVVGLPNHNLISYGEKWLTLVELHEFRVHKSLTRYFSVFQK